MKTRELFILSGGPGKEHDVSLSSGRNIASELSDAGISFQLITVEKDLSWNYNEKLLSEEEGLTLLKECDALVLQVIHGTYGEDGVLTAKLEERGVPCVGSSSSALSLTIDKFKTEKLLQKYGIPTPESRIMTKGDNVETSSGSFPCIVKPTREGSSVSLSKVNSQNELRDVLRKVLVDYDDVLVQNYVKGREFTCGVVEINGDTVALSPTEVILTKGELFDYEAKYTAGGCVEVTPAEIDDETTKRIQVLAREVHVLSGCKDISRTDIIMKENGELVVLEINTIPGMTKTSFIPAQLVASGYTIVSFIENMIEKYE
jgi:D-alanine-D-alanine ligase